MKDKTIPTNETQNQPVPIVAIGAGAGGIEAATEIFKHLSHQTGMAYIYIQHVDASVKSKLSVKLKQVTVMKVYEAKHNMPVESDTVYVIPPEKNMAIENGLLKLANSKKNPALPFPIDYLFSSLADYNKHATIGILLSGSSTDGVLGLKAIKAAGGISYVQDESALVQSMPQAAIAEDVVDMILSPTEIAGELERLSKETDRISNIMIDAEEVSSVKDDDDILDIIRLLKKSIGVDFFNYKRNTIKRRIIRRMLLHKLSTLKEYDQFLKQHLNEITALYKDLLINVTCFFRDADTIEYLKKTVLPKIIAAKSSSEPLRIWIPACSTGEEAYSMAMILFEILGTKSSNTSIQIFATDLSEHAIGKARLGLYSKNDLANVSPNRIERFFTKVDGHYRIIKAIRDICVYSPHNVFRDPPFSRMDVISCCNLFIYLEPVLQKKVIATFHYALNPNGYLILGKSEALGGSPQLFTQLEKKYKLFKRKEATSKAFFDMNYRLPESGNKDFVPFKKVKLPEEGNGKPEDLDKNVDALLMQKFVPPSIIVNQELEILQFKGSTGLFLEPPSGKATFSLLKMARHGLGFELRNIIHKANKSQQPFKKAGLKIERNGTFHTVSIEAVPLKNNNEERLFLVIFQENDSVTKVESKINYSKNELVKKLQDELETLKDDMRSIVEDQEASNEELQSANEEIVSSNEELQSINEELETSKEEIESSNEELMTINQELQVRNDQLAESYEYAEAVFTTMRESVLILDKALRIKSGNRSFYNTFQLRDSDTEDFLLYEVANGQWKIPKLKEALDKIISGELLQIQSLEIRHSFSQVGEKIMLVNIRRIIQKSHRNEIILMAIEDITVHRRGQQIIEERQEWLRNMADSAPVIIWVTNVNKQFTFFNKTWFDYTGSDPRSDTGNQWIAAIHPEDKTNYDSLFEECFAAKEDFASEFRLKDNAGNYRWAMCNAKPSYSHEKKMTGYVGTIVDMHDRKIASDDLELRVKKRTKALLEANKNLERSNNELQQFAYVASHDLQEPLRKIRTFSSRLQTKFKQEMTEDVAGHVLKISDSSKRMTELISDLLDFSRATNPNELFEAVDLTVVLKDVLSGFELIINDKKIEVITEGVFPLVMAVQVQMVQLFHNLLGNAFKFSSANPHPKISIHSEKLSAQDIKTHRLNKNRTYYKISVRDNGIGFEQEYAQQIFTIFQRLNDKRDYPGTGIGLALCKKIMDYHEGLIYATSEKNKGATFEVILPLYFEKQ